MKRLGIKPDGDELYDEFQKIYDESVDRDTNTEKVDSSVSIFFDNIMRA